MEQKTADNARSVASVMPKPWLPKLAKVMRSRSRNVNRNATCRELNRGGIAGRDSDMAVHSNPPHRSGEVIEADDMTCRRANLRHGGRWLVARRRTVTARRDERA